MAENLSAVDRSVWRYYRNGGKGFAARHADGLRAAPCRERTAEKDALARAAAQTAAEKSPGDKPARSFRRGRPRSADDAAVDRARQALLGMILRDTADGGHPSVPLDENMVKAQVETMSPEALQKMTAFFSTVKANGETVSPSLSASTLKSLDGELAKRGISLQLSGKVNNVYLSGENATWAVNASAGADAEADRRLAGDKTTPRGRRYNNFGQTVGRAARNFILGH